MNEPTLRECPFCGGEAVLETTIGRKGYDACVFCNCSASVCSVTCDDVSEAEIEAIAAWNRRAERENELIVRCGGCKHYNRIGCSDGFGWCERMNIGTNDDFYCSLAERSEGGMTFCEKCKKYTDCKDGSGLTWPCGAYRPISITNADRIRGMSDNELAELLVRYNGQYDDYTCSDGQTFFTEKEAVEHELDWLTQPAETEGTE